MNGKPHFLEIVSSDVDALVRHYETSVGLTFADPVLELGGARVADLPGGSRLSIRGPLAPDEGPLWRVYLAIDDLAAATAAARDAGAEVMLEGMEIPGQGKISIVKQGGVEHGLWQE